jgi:hypothetical protein
MSRAYASGKHALAECDVCGFTYPYTALRRVTSNGALTGVRACPTCWDPDHPQNKLKRVDASDPQALRHPRPPGNLEQQRQIVTTPEFDAVMSGVYPPPPQD